MYLKHSAAIIIRNQKVLLIKRSQHENSAQGKWCAPNETVEKNESPENAIVRGVPEELGIAFVITKQLSEHFYEGHTTFVFLGTAEGEIQPNPKEVADYGWFSYQDTKDLDFAYDYDKVIQKLYDLGLLTF